MKAIIKTHITHGGKKFYTLHTDNNKVSSVFSDLPKVKEWLRIRGEIFGENYKVEFAPVDSTNVESTNDSDNDSASVPQCALPTASAQENLDAYMKHKDKHNDAVLLFWLEDSYEIYHQDAEDTATCLGLQKVTRVLEDGSTYAACSFPRSDISIYLPKLVRCGFRVAII